VEDKEGQRDEGGGDWRGRKGTGGVEAEGGGGWNDVYKSMCGGGGRRGKQRVGREVELAEI